MADLQNEISNLMGRKSLDPLQQTVFEKGPQSSFTPPEVQNVYQEGRDILPNPNAVAIQQPINWYGLGQNAFDMAQKTFANVLDYMIETKSNGIRDAKDQAQSKLYEIEAQMSAESYNANHEYRPRDPATVDKLLANTKQITKEYNNKVQGILGDDYAGFSDPNLDMNNLGTRYQGLALTNRNSQRDIDRTVNSMMYRLERVTKGAQMAYNENDSWKHGVAPRPSQLTNAMYMGTMPLPNMPDGKPIIGFDGDKPQMVSTQEGLIPVVIPNPMDPTNKTWLFNNNALDYLNQDQIRALVEAEPYLISSTGDVVKPFEDMAKFVAENSTNSPGVARYVAQGLTKVTDQQADALIRRLATRAPDQIKLSLLRLAAMQGKDASSITDIANLTYDQIDRKSQIVRALATGASESTAGNLYISHNGASAEELNNIAQTANTIEKALGNVSAPVSVFADNKQGRFTESVNGTNTSRLTQLLQANPMLTPIITRALISLDQNRALFLKPDGTEDAALKSKALGDIINTQINSNGFIQLDHTADGIPRYVYAPGLGDVNEVKQRYFNDPSLAQRYHLSDPDAKTIKDPTTQNQILAKSSLVDTVTPFDAVSIAQQFSPQVSVPLLQEALTAFRPSERTANGITTSGYAQDLTKLDLLRLSIACTPAALAAHNFDHVENMPLEQRMAAVKTVLDDLPLTSPKRAGFAPWLGADFNTSASAIGYIGRENGGIPVKLTQILGEPREGKDQIDYMRLITSNQKRGDIFTGFSPSTVDNIPTLMIPSVYMDRSGKGWMNEGRLKANVKKWVAGMGGDWKSVQDSPDAPLSYSLLDEPNGPQNLIAATTEPYVPKLMQDTIGNKLVDSPLKDADSAIAFVHQSGVMLERIVDSDPSLRPVKKLLFEATYVNGDQIPEDKRSLFSPDNLKALYQQAVAHGAKTNSDFVGFIFGAMKNAADNPRSILARNFEAQQFTKASYKDDIVPTGPNAGRILWETQSSQFNDLVMKTLEAGKSIYANVAPENPNRLAFYVMDDNDPRILRDGYAKEIDPSMLDQMKASDSGKGVQQRRDAEKVRSILFPPKTPPSTEAVRAVARQSTLPSDMQDVFRDAFKRFLMEHPLQDNPDAPFVDLAGYYRDSGKMPDSVQAVDPKYILPGHSSTVDWVDTPSTSTMIAKMKAYTKSIQDSSLLTENPNLTRADSLTSESEIDADSLNFVVKAAQNFGQYAAYPLGVLAGFGDELGGALKNAFIAVANLPEDLNKALSKTVEESNKNADLEDFKKIDNAAAKVIGGIKEGGDELGGALKKAFIALANLPYDVNEALKKAQEPYAEHRAEVLKQVNEDPVSWMTSAFSDDAMATMRKAVEVDVPEKIFDSINAFSLGNIIPNKDLVNKLYSQSKSLLSWDDYQKLNDLSFSPIEQEYQLRLELQDKKKNLSSAVQALDNNKFALDNERQFKLATDLFVVSKEAGHPITKEAAKKLSEDPTWRPDIKKAFFNLTLYPDGMLARRAMTSEDSRRQALLEMLTQQ